MKEILSQIASDRSLTQEQRDLAVDLLALLPPLLELRKRGYGELTAKVQDGKVVHGRATLDWKAG